MCGLTILYIFLNGNLLPVLPRKSGQVNLSRGTGVIHRLADLQSNLKKMPSGKFGTSIQRYVHWPLKKQNAFN